jgi:hypothetical protein
MQHVALPVAQLHAPVDVPTHRVVPCVADVLTLTGFMFLPLPLQLDLWSVADANNHLFKLPTLVDMLHELLAPYAELRLTPGALHDMLHDMPQKICCGVIIPGDLAPPQLWPDAIAP